MNKNLWSYQCQEDSGDEPDDDDERWIHPEEIPEDDDADDEMDEM